MNYKSGNSGPWEKYKFEKRGDFFLIKSWHNQYLASEMDGRANHNRKEAHAWEEFYLYDGGDGSMTIMNPEHMTYLKADPNSNIIKCDETDYKLATKFIGWNFGTGEKSNDETPSAGEPAIMTVKPEDAKAGDVLASLPKYFMTVFTARHEKNGWGVWYKPDADQFVFKSKDTRQNLVALDNFQVKFTDVWGPWEKFQVIAVPNMPGLFSIKSFHNKFLACEKSGEAIMNRDKP